MKQQSGSKRLSTFARYVVSYMLVLLLALSALFLYMYVYMNREVRLRGSRSAQRWPTLR